MDKAICYIQNAGYLLSQSQPRGICPVQPQASRPENSKSLVFHRYIAGAESGYINGVTRWRQ